MPGGWLLIPTAVLLLAFLVVSLVLARARQRQAEIKCERLLQRSKAERKRLDDLIATVPGVVWETRIDPDNQQHKTTFVSSQAEKLVGYSPQQWLDTPDFCLQLVHEEDRESVVAEVERVLAGADHGVLQFRWIAKDKHILWVKAQLAPVKNESGEIIGTRGVTIDMTEQQLAEAGRRQSEEKNLAILEELQRNEERFAKAFRANPQPMSLTTLGNGRYIDVNESFLAMSRYTREEVIGHTSLELQIWETPDDRAQFVQRLNDLGSLVNFETKFRTKDGSLRVLLSSAEKLDIGGQACLLVASSDITERIEAELALRTANDELQQLKNQLEAENVYLQQELQLDERFGEIVGQSDAIKYVLFKIGQVAPTDSTVLITGETGTGKELAARAIHGASARKDRPLIKVNCGALAPTLIESELFGHEKGAFTGAVGRKQGRFELANGGTIFLDEIGELPPSLQVKLLRVIQESEFERLGGSKTIKIDVRIIAATNRNLKQEVEQGTFREDLWYRLNVYPVTMPPLRQRKEDVPLLVEHFAAMYAKKFGKTILSVSPRTMQSLQTYSWPGNVRELANVIERAVIHSHGSSLQIVDQFEQLPAEALPPTQTLEEVERDYIIRTLENTGWRIEGPFGAAKILGLNPSTLRTRMVKLGIQRHRATSS